MKRLLLCVAIVAGLIQACPPLAEAAGPHRYVRVPMLWSPPRTVRSVEHPVAKPAPVEERIIALPEDGEVWHTSLFVHHDWQTRPAERELVAWFDANPRLASLKGQTHFHLYTDHDVWYQQNFRAHVTELPAVLLQRSDGEIVHRASGASLKGPVPLANQIATSVSQRCYRGRCPAPGPTPVPMPQPQPLPEPIPVLPDPVAPPPEDYTLLIIIAVVSLIVGGVAYEWRKNG